MQPRKPTLVFALCMALAASAACRRKKPAPAPPAAAATPSPSEQKRMARLLDAVEAAKDIVFIRNDAEYPSWAARQWIERKYKKYGVGVLTAEDLITSVAARSETTKEPYRVRLADGRTTESAYWLRALLAGIEKPPPP